MIKENNFTALRQQPSHDWQEQTRARLEVLAKETVTKSEQSRSKDNATLSVTLLFMRKTFFIVPLALVLVLVPASFVLLNITQEPDSSADEEAFLATFVNRIAQNQNTQREAAPVAEDVATLAAPEAQISAELTMLPGYYPRVPYFGELPNTTYVYEHTEITPGAAAGQCAPYEDLIAPTATLSLTRHSYNRNSNESMFAQKFLGRNGAIIRDEVNRNELNKSTTELYRGGDYILESTYLYDTVGFEETALLENELHEIPPGQIRLDTPRETGVEPVDLPTPVENNDVDFIEQLDAKIIETRKEQGETVFVIEYTYPINCDTALIGYFSEESNEQNDTIIVRANVVEDTQVIINQEEYLNSVDNGQLLVRYVHEQQGDNRSFNQVESLFTLNYNVPTETVIMDNTRNQAYNPSQDIEQTVKALQEQSTPVVIEAGNDASLVSIYVTGIFGSEAEQRYRSLLSDRSFYAPGSFGETLYAQEYPSQDSIESDTFYSLQLASGEYISVQRFSNTTEEQVVNQILQADTIERVAESTVTLSLDGEDTQAQFIQYTYDDNIILYDTVVPEPLANEMYPESLVAVTFGNAVYIFQGQFSADMITTINFDLVNPDGEIDRVTSLVQQVFTPFNR